MDNPAELARRAVTLLDLTELSDSGTAAAVEVVCARAAGPAGNAAAVCVWPSYVSLAVKLLRGTGIKVATVVNFPSGGIDVGATVNETVAAVADEADEIDLVLPYHALLAGHPEVAVTMVQAIRRATPHPLKLKVILESGEYPDLDRIAQAARLVIEHGADFVKTSTGKTSVSATLAAVEVILREIRASERNVGVKPSGGIRTLDDARRYLELADDLMGPGWTTPDTFRFGASSLLDALEAVIAESSPSHDGAPEHSARNVAEY